MVEATIYDYPGAWGYCYLEVDGDRVSTTSYRTLFELLFTGETLLVSKGQGQAVDIRCFDPTA